MVWEALFALDVLVGHLLLEDSYKFSHSIFTQLSHKSFFPHQGQSYPLIIPLFILKMKFIDDLCEKMISPLKIRYSIHDLNTSHSSIGKRADFTVQNCQKQKIQASFYHCSHSSEDQRICVLYLHSMNGSRLQSVGYIEEILKMGLFFCHFDFTGCGNSEGSRISFGANEKYDVLAVFESLKEKYNIKKFILWGRSMGSACALKFCELINNSYQRLVRKEVIAVILDSCFRSFSKLVVEIGNKYSDYPELLIKAGYFFVKGTLQEKGSFKVHDLELTEIVHNFNVPALFLTSKEDTTVKSQHSEILFDLYGHKIKRLSYFKGMHNQARDADYLGEVKKFIQQILRMNRSSSLQFKEMKTTRFQRLMSNRKNFVLEKDESYEVNEGCYCSLFATAKMDNQKRSYQQLQQRRRRTENLTQREKIRLSKLAIQSPKQLKTHSRYTQKYFK